MKGGVERSIRGAATAAQTLTDIQNGVVERTVQKDLETLHRKKVNGATRNAVLFGPTDSNNHPSALSAGMNPLDLKVSGAVIPVTISFAKGFDKDTGPVDTVVSITTDEVVNLPALDANTVPINYTSDLCTGGTPISGGDNAGQLKANAFDNDAGTNWASSQTYTSVSGNAAIGYQFTGNKKIRKVTVNQSTTGNGHVTSVKIQYSDNGSAWSDAYTATGLVMGQNVIVVPDAGSHMYWRLLAASNTPTSGYGWGVYELEMLEGLETLYVYAEKVGDHGYQLGYTKQKPRYDIVSDTYTDNLCKGGAAISSGDSAGFSVTNLFDSNLTTYWISSQTGTVISGAAWAGYNFGVPRNVKKIKYRTDAGLDDNNISSIKIQQSNDGTNWTDVQTFSGLPVLSNQNVELNLASQFTAQYVRLLANENLPSSIAWALGEVEMFGLATDLHFYNQVAETMNYWNGAAWEQKDRVFIGEAYTTTTARYGYKTYDYDAARLSVAPATLAGMPVNLGQFSSCLEDVGFQKLPGGLIIQWVFESSFVEPANNHSAVLTFKEPFPRAVLAVVPTMRSNSLIVGLDSLQYYNLSLTSVTIAVDEFSSQANPVKLGCIAFGY
jgi:hypothetical protein